MALYPSNKILRYQLCDKFYLIYCTLYSYTLGQAKCSLANQCALKVNILVQYYLC